MANDVRNEFSFMCEAPYISKIRLKISELKHQLTHSDLETVLWPSGVPTSLEYDRRIRFTDEYGDDFGFRSAWGPCTAVQIRLCQILADVAPNVAVINLHSEEFGQAVGAGISVALDGKFVTLRSDEDLSARISEIREQLTECEEVIESDDETLDEEMAISEEIDELVDDTKHNHLDQLRVKIGIGTFVLLEYI